MAEAGGVFVAAATPHTKESHTADLGATLELVDFLCRSGVQGIALFGSTGEFLNFNIDDRVRLVHLASKRSRVPVLAGVAHPTFDGAVELGREACSGGASGLLLMPPLFFRYSQQDIKEYYLEYAEQLGRGADIYLYNIPFFTNELACETAVELLETGLFSGIKDSSGKTDYMDRLLEARSRRPFTVLVGNDVIFTRSRQAGANGIVSGVACAVPELLIGLDRAIRAGDAAAVGTLEARLQEFIGWLNKLPTPVGVRIAVAARGLKMGGNTMPLSDGNERVASEFREWLKGWVPAVVGEAARA